MGSRALAGCSPSRLPFLPFFRPTVFFPPSMLRVLLAVLLAAPACAQSGKPPDPSDPRPRRADSVVTDSTPGEALADTTFVSRTVSVRIGETPVTIVVTDGCAVPRWSAINMHDDENTAVEAALSVIARGDGRLVEVKHTGARNLTFRLGGETFTVDPNRIFTPAGRARTLAALSRDTPAARQAVAAFADTLLAIYGEPAVVVALHNNTEASYSALGYAPGGSDAREAAAVHLVPGMDPDDFVFVTTRPLYDAAVASGFNAILQNNATPTDDGSLSVWAAQQGRPYVNIEAQHGHREANARMIRALVGWISGE